MKIAYFDCVAGASGDMILGALVDAGLSIETLRERLNALHLADFELQAHRVAKNAFTATKVDVLVKDDVPERHLSDIVRVVEDSDLPPDIKQKAIVIFHKIGEGEAHIHGTSMDHVHLHELGGVDTIVDVVGALVGLDALGVERVVASPVPLGRGFIRGAHGQIPLPAPATLSLLKGVPIVGSPLQMETVTPTGAALLANLAEAFGPIPPMTLDGIGYGAGSRDLPIPNVLRVLIGEEVRSPKSEVQASHEHGHSHAHGEHTHTHEHGHSHAHDEHTHTHSKEDGDHHHPHTHEHDAHEHDGHTHTHTSENSPLLLSPLAPLHSSDRHHHHDHSHPHDHAHPHEHSCLDVDSLTVLETNIDDLNPEFYEYVMGRLFDAGALDVFFAPIQMKKNRPATLLRVLCRPDGVEAMTRVIFEETSTLGIREHAVKRHALPREIRSVETPYGEVHVKVARLGDGREKAAPEYEDCRCLAEQQHVPIQDVYRAAERAL
jgi:uncharacterized protein (DUF111 family)